MKDLRSNMHAEQAEDEIRLGGARRSRPCAPRSRRCPCERARNAPEGGIQPLAFFFRSEIAGPYSPAIVCGERTICSSARAAARINSANAASS
jgi:hypothetical protein